MLICFMQVPIGCRQDQNVSSALRTRPTGYNIDRAADNCKLVELLVQRHTLAWSIASKRLLGLKGMFVLHGTGYTSDCGLVSLVSTAESKLLS